MAIKSRRTARGPHHGIKQQIQTTGLFNGIAQAGVARPKRAHALAEELLARGNMFIQSQVWDEAAREFRKAIKMEPDYAEAHNNLGLCLYYAEKPEEAILSLKEALRYFPGWTVALANLGLAQGRAGQHQEAAASYQSSLNKKPEQPVVWLALGDEQAAVGKMDEALAAYQKAVSLSPKYSLAFARMGLVHARRNKIEEAKAALSQAVSLEPDNADALAVLGVIAARQGDLAGAQSYFYRVNNLGGRTTAAVRGTHRLEIFRTGLKKAFDEWKANAPHAPALAVCFYNLALAHLAAGHDAEAKTAFQQAIAIQPDWAEPLIWFGFFSALGGEAIGARRCWETASKLQPQNGMLYEQLGYLAVAMGLQKETEMMFAKAGSLGRTIPEADLRPDDAARSGLQTGVATAPPQMDGQAEAAPQDAEQPDANAEEAADEEDVEGGEWEEIQ